MVEILRITYYLYEFKRTKQGEVPIYCKLTTDGINRQQFSTRLYIRPEIWDKDAQCVRGTSEDAVLINRRLQDITVELKSIERKLYEADGNVSLDEIYSLYKNKTANEHTLCGIFRERIKRMESLAGKCRVVVIGPCNGVQMAVRELELREQFPLCRWQELV